MDIPSPIALMLVLVMGTGEATIDLIPQPSTQACWNAARQFILRNPQEYNAIAIGAGCIVHPDGRGAER